MIKRSSIYVINCALFNSLLCITRSKKLIFLKDIAVHWVTDQISSDDIQRTNTNTNTNTINIYIRKISYQIYKIRYSRKVFYRYEKTNIGKKLKALVKEESVEEILKPEICVNSVMLYYKVFPTMSYFQTILVFLLLFVFYKISIMLNVHKMTNYTIQQKFNKKVFLL